MQFSSNVMFSVGFLGFAKVPLRPDVNQAGRGSWAVSPEKPCCPAQCSDSTPGELCWPRLISWLLRGSASSLPEQFFSKSRQLSLLLFSLCLNLLFTDCHYVPFRGLGGQVAEERDPAHWNIPPIK